MREIFWVLLALMGWILLTAQTIIGCYWWLRARRYEEMFGDIDEPDPEDEEAEFHA